MNDNSHLIRLGSKTAKDGFKNEQYVVDEFNNWKSSELGRQWLRKMEYNLDEIESVSVTKITGQYKADIQVVIKAKNRAEVQNIQVKLVSNPKGFNQIDKRWLSKYTEMWDMSDDVQTLLKYFTGELPPHKPNTRDKRRMFVDELTEAEQAKLVDFVTQNKTLIVSDILKGRGEFAAEWMLVVLKDGIDSDTMLWALEPMNVVLNLFGSGPVVVTSKGSIYIGKITMQRKGGDNGRPTANMLQFKINPALLVEGSFEKEQVL